VAHCFLQQMTLDWIRDLETRTLCMPPRLSHTEQTASKSWDNFASVFLRPTNKPAMLHSMSPGSMSKSAVFASRHAYAPDDVAKQLESLGRSQRLSLRRIVLLARCKPMAAALRRLQL